MNIIDSTNNLFDSLYKRLTPQRFYPMLLGVLVLGGLLPLLMPGLPSGHDLYYHLSRLHAMDVNLRLGEFPSMINHEALGGYGYATGLFYPDLFLYPALLLMRCGIGIVAAYKCLIVIGLLGIAFSAYYCARKLSASCFGAFITAILYSWSSYIASDLFIREAFGECCFFIFMPWIILGLYEITLGDPRKFWYLSLGFAGLVCAHSLSLFIMAVVCAVFFSFNVVHFLREPRRILFLAISPIPTILVGMAYLLPTIEQFSHLNFIIEYEKNENILERCMPFLKLVLEIPTSKMDYWYPAGIGTMMVIVALQRFRLPALRRTPSEHFRDMILIAGFCCLLMATDMPSWQGWAKPLAVIQFPWRFFGPATAFLAFGCGLVLPMLVGQDHSHERSWVWLVIFGAAFAWFVNVGYFYAARISEHDITKNYRIGRPQEASGLHYLVKDGLLDKEIRLRGDVAMSSHPLDIVLSRPQTNLLQLSFSGNTTDNDVELPLVPYYGYAAQLQMEGTTQNLKVGLGPNKLLSVHIPRECTNGIIRVCYKATRLQRLSQAISLVSVSILLVFCIVKWRRQWKQPTSPFHA
ncbi:MAG: hypothetical protein IKP00_17600 [Victivallales bacterium]|nr:hypothetical protein [Victivallales bacterium]